jgi:anaerobic selenocysteine-containing dehydrogenase
MIRHKGERGFSRIDWADALAAIGTHVGRSSPDRLGFYMTSRGQPNENYYAAQKSVRALGTNSIEIAASICHSPSTFGIKGPLGVGATT